MVFILKYYMINNLVLSVTSSLSLARKPGGHVTNTSTLAICLLIYFSKPYHDNDIKYDKGDNSSCTFLNMLKKTPKKISSKHFFNVGNIFKMQI